MLGYLGLILVMPWYVAAGIAYLVSRVLVAVYEKVTGRKVPVQG
jgi:hypothetical protein